MELVWGRAVDSASVYSLTMGGKVVCGVIIGSSTETEVLATVAKAPADEACALTLKIDDTVGADSAIEMTEDDGPNWDDVTEDTPVSLEACDVVAKLEETKADEVSVVDESRDASVAKEEET